MNCEDVLKHEPTIVQEDNSNSACVQAAESVYITRGLQRLPLAEDWFEEKVAEGVCLYRRERSWYRRK